MPFWKKKKEPATPKKKLCPNCLAPGLKQTVKTDGFFSNVHYQCSSCDYKGLLYIVPNSEEDRAEDIEELAYWREQFPEDVIPVRSIEVLAQESLKTKWHPDQPQNQTTLLAWCPYCAEFENQCSICSIPPQICQNHATSGWIGELNNQYPNETKLCDVDPEIYQKIVHAFQEIVDRAEFTDNDSESAAETSA